nr:MAG TPA: hypothetical protein [Caudoviricetes sp.]
MIIRGGKIRCNHAPYGSKEMQERRRLPDSSLLMKEVVDCTYFNDHHNIVMEFLYYR